MALTDLTPADWIPSWALASGSTTDSISFDLDEFPEMSAAEAAADGSFPNVLYALLHRFYSLYSTIEVASRPTNMTMSRGISGDPDTDVLEETFTFRFNTETATGSRNVVDEA